MNIPATPSTKFGFRSLITGLLALILFTGTGCTALMRGFQQDQLVSNGYPPITIGSSLPLTLSGRCMPLVLSEMQYVTPQTWLAVYGAQNAQSPMAIAAYTVAPQAFEWDLPSASLIDGPVTSEVAFGDQSFSASVHVLSGVNDPFAPLVASTPEEAEKITWLVQRYSNLSDFRRTKIILEYREPLPASLEDMRDSISSMLNNPELRQFASRAEAAFSVAFAFEGQNIPAAPWIGNDKQLNLRRISRFMGSLSPIQPFLNEIGGDF